jgi:uncharacterized protein YegJ (DUF2314 family)
MTRWWQKNVPCMFSILFRGELPQQPGEFAFLRDRGIAITPQPPMPQAYWSTTLRHDDWGEAGLICLRDMPRLPREIIDYAWISPQEKETALQGESSLVVHYEGKNKDVLRDRKMGLRFARAVMGDDGVAVLDHLAQRVWSREMLEDELCHDADLDVEGVYALHGVTRPNEEVPYWLHTHGLGEIGGFDMTVFKPHADLLGGNGTDLLRSLAFAVVEGRVHQGTARFQVTPKGAVRFVPMPQFLANGPADLVALLKDEVEGHQQRHAVLCNPEGGFFARWFGNRLTPSRLLSSPMPDGTVINFSADASNLMARRACDTYQQFRRFHEEFAEFGFTAVVKLGYQVDGGGEDSREHLWFEVHAVEDEAIDATLLNAPYGIARLKQGDRGRHAVTLISDWVVFTPVGNITPRSFVPARILRPHREEMLRLMQEAQAAES